ncbi:MAG TPA: nuclear transport factor 2 family protein [Thermoanaerobaculia bacterium]|jgi:ketosteroid isomerase-like protein
MSENKRTIETYIDGFNKSDHAQILGCLTDDVVWEIPGMFHITGKEAFDGQIENDAFVGSPTVTIARLVEENDVVVAEGAVRSARKDGGVLNALFCDVFVMERAKIKRLTSYLAVLE